MQTIKVTANGEIVELPLMNIKGKPYLQVAHRIVWFRKVNPLGNIETVIIKTDDNSTLAKAIITDNNGKVIAMAHKQENKQGFADHLEKAETGAIGRALGIAGFGTQFAPEFDEEDRLADSPVTRIVTEAKPASLPNPSLNDMIKQKPANHAPATGGTEISEAQMKRYWALAKQLGWDKDDCVTNIKQQTDGQKDSPKLLTRQEYTIITAKMQAAADNKVTF